MMPLCVRCACTVSCALRFTLMSQLLTRDPEKRLSDASMIKKHKWFESIDWDKLYNLQVPPPFVPTVRGKSDISQIDPSFTEQKATISSGNPLDQPFSPGTSATFENFTFVSN
jgi:hypothetical protein